MFKLISAVPTFLVADVGATISWYETELGFTSYPFPAKPPYVFASVCRDGIEIMFQLLRGYEKLDLHRLRDGGVWDAYIRMEGGPGPKSGMAERDKLILGARAPALPVIVAATAALRRLGIRSEGSEWLHCGFQ